MKYTISILTFIIINFITLTSYGRTITIEEATSKAKEFISTQQGYSASRTNSTIDLVLVDISQYLYVFNNPTGGFIIISSEDSAESILGYSNTGRMDNDIPVNLKAWIRNYERQIEYAKENNIRYLASRADATPVKRDKIEPLIKTKWDQGSPYNKYCPEINGRKCWAGCVATAMAQVMNYYKWPDKAHGEHYYYWQDQKLSIDLDNTVFDWDNMTMDNIAQLMKICGYTTSMSYGLNSSGAHTASAFNALKNYFYYKGERLQKISTPKSQMEWFDYCYDVLSTKHPILCSVVGLGGDPGHACVCDGYDGKGYFHFNWGWSGHYDGYFRLDAVKEVGYKFGQFNEVIVVEPDYEKIGDVISPNTTAHMPFLYIGDKDGQDRYNDENEPDDIYSSMINSEDICLIKEVGLRIVDSNSDSYYLSLYGFDENNEVTIREDNTKWSSWQSAVRVGYILNIAQELGLKDGIYKAYPAYIGRSDNNWHDIIIDYDYCVRYVLMKVTNGKISFYMPDMNDTSVIVKDRTIHIEKANAKKICIFNASGMMVYSGYDETIKLSCGGLYTIRIDTQSSPFFKSIVVK